jgi:hypothetical protein
MSRDAHSTGPAFNGSSLNPASPSPSPSPSSRSPTKTWQPSPSPSRSAKASVIKAPKAHSADACERLEQLPNIGPALAADLRLIGIQHPAELRGQDPLALYQQLCRVTGQRHDPCVLDTFMAATDFMGGAPAAPWWAYTPLRKSQFGAL